ncbi:MAG: RND family transporter [Anaerolineaceae bacterium]|nr:MAG: RND family transporter [Anaerolineaceae bacterium]
MASTVSVNYNMVDYLPRDAGSTIAVRIIEEEFVGDMPGARVMINDVSIMEALEYKELLTYIEGVTSVGWLDDVIGIDTLQSVPLEFLDKAIVENYYKDNNALMTISIESGKEQNTVAQLYDLIGEDNAASGEAITSAEMQNMSVSEVLNAMLILLPIVILVLIISTSSWVEPLLFLSSIGIAIVINMGTNIIFGEISFISNTVSPILQLAVSLDYAIFLLHSFNNHRLNEEPGKAMVLAMKESVPTVAASAATTVIGFAALMFMRFGIGADLGINLLKGVLLSFISVMVFMPALTLLLYKAIDKTRHRKLMPDFKSSGKLIIKIRIPFMILALIIVIPTFLAQSKTQFMYGTGDITATSRVGRDTALIEESFGKENLLVLLVPKENTGKEKELCEELTHLQHIKSIVSYVNNVGAEIPQEFVPDEAYDQFYSENYSRIILYTDTNEEDSAAFETIEAIMDITQGYYDSHYIAGTSATLYDMKNMVSTDNRLVNLIAVIGIYVVLLLTFRSISLPFILVFCIETAIWINLSVPYFTDKPINFLGYLIISTVQLGATVDYAILFTSSYLNNRKAMSPKDSMRDTISNNLVAIFTSAIILASAGFALALTSNNPIISELGLLLGRGTLLSLTMVAFVLPALLVLFDSLIQKTTMKVKQ